MFVYLLSGIGLLIVIFAIAAAMQPDEFRVTRSATFKAKPEQIFEQINDLHHFNAWSPWAKMDPNATINFIGPQAGPGAKMAWEGKKIGAGSMTVTETQSFDKIIMRLDFLKPMQATNMTVFTLHPESDQVTVTWTMSGKNNFIGKAIGLLMNCNKMVGGQFEQGLANLKTVVETGS